MHHKYVGAEVNLECRFQNRGFPCDLTLARNYEAVFKGRNSLYVIRYFEIVVLIKELLKALSCKAKISLNG